jgi:hypothetical protein
MEPFTVMGWSGCANLWTMIQSGSFATVGSTSLATAGGIEMWV